MTVFAVLLLSLYDLPQCTWQSTPVVARTFATLMGFLTLFDLGQLKGYVMHTGRWQFASQCQ